MSIIPGRMNKMYKVTRRHRRSIAAGTEKEPLNAAEELVKKQDDADNDRIVLLCCF